jgi:hypothetical protein
MKELDQQQAKYAQLTTTMQQLQINQQPQSGSAAATGLPGALHSFQRP